MKLLILISSLAIAYSRPQTQNGNQPAAELESAKTSIRNTKYDTTEVSDLTKEILQKIEQINQKHGYTTRSPIKKDFKYYPHFYTYSYQHPTPFRKVSDASLMKAEEIKTTKEDEDDVNGQRIKRKITHQQSYLLPQKEPPVQYLMMIPLQSNYPIHPFNRYNYEKQMYNPSYSKEEENAVNYLEQQMLDNLKSIILKSQLPPNIEGITFNPLVQSLPHENSFVQYRKPDIIYGSSGYINNIPNMPWNVYQYEGYTPDKEIEAASLKSNPVALYNSLTTITEYDSSGEKCKTAIDQIDNSNARNAKSFVIVSGTDQQRYIVDIDKSIEVAAFTENGNPMDRILVLRKDNEKSRNNPDVNNVLLPQIDDSNIRSEKKIIKPAHQNIKDDDKKALNPFQLFLQNQQNKNKPSGEAEKDIINESGKKVLSNDNTGSGIFIHRLKVRKGGVAIAGPGGIATAGSGGTAIVGPNGFAYTHPDSLAIAGTGSRVIAVDPKVNLGDIVKGKEDGSRVGKLVAIGPVIYYNKG